MQIDLRLLKNKGLFAVTLLFLLKKVRLIKEVGKENASEFK